MITAHINHNGQAIEVEIQDTQNGRALVKALEGKPFIQDQARSDPEEAERPVRTNWKWVANEELTQVARDGIVLIRKGK